MNDSLVTWADMFGGRSLAVHAAKHPSSIGDRTSPAAGVSLDAAAVARVNGGRLLADCPADGCAGAEYVNPDEPLFFCCECRNGAFGNQPVRVALPDAALFAAVTRYLVARPTPATRNWRPGETVAQLRTENRAHGIRLRGES